MRVLALLLIFPYNICNAQSNDSISNGGFENWIIDTIDVSPVGWNSNFTWDSIAFPLIQSDSGFNSSKCLRLETTQIEDDTIIASVAIGNIGSDFYNIINSSFTSTIGGIYFPYSASELRFNYKANIEPGDRALLIMTQYGMGSKVISDHQIFTSTNEWTQGSMMVFIHGNPDSLILSISSSAISGNVAKPGNWLMIDNLQFTHLGTPVGTVPNAGFEQWDSLFYHHAPSWDSDNKSLASEDLESFSISSYSHSGDYSAMIETLLDKDDDTIIGTLEYGELLDKYYKGTSFNVRPTHLDLYYEFHPILNDSAWVKVEFFSENSVIGSGFYSIHNSVSSWEQLQIPLTINNQPDSVSITLKSGSNPGTILYVDDIRFTGIGTGLVENPSLLIDVRVYPNPAAEFFEVDLNDLNVDEYSISLFSSEGKLISAKSKTVNNKVTFNIKDLPGGIYFIKVYSDKMILSQKVIIEKS